MNKQTIAADWKTLRGRIREQWGQITDDDLAKTQGNFEQIVGLIQRKTGEGRELAGSFLEVRRI